MVLAVLPIHFHGLSCNKALLAAFGSSGIGCYMVERGKNTWSKEGEQEVEFLPRAGASHCTSCNTAVTKGSLVPAITRQLSSSISTVLPSPGPLWLPCRGQVKPLPCSHSLAQELHLIHNGKQVDSQRELLQPGWEFGLVSVCAVATQH